MGEETFPFLEHCSSSFLLNYCHKICTRINDDGKWWWSNIFQVATMATQKGDTYTFTIVGSFGSALQKILQDRRRRPHDDDPRSHLTYLLFLFLASDNNASIGVQLPVVLLGSLAGRDRRATRQSQPRQQNGGVVLGSHWDIRCLKILVL